jgi:hypothetical protein
MVDFNARKGFPRGELSTISIEQVNIILVFVFSASKGGTSGTK